MRSIISSEVPHHSRELERPDAGRERVRGERVPQDTGRWRGPTARTARSGALANRTRGPALLPHPSAVGASTPRCDAPVALRLIQSLHRSSLSFSRCACSSPFSPSRWLSPVPGRRRRLRRRARIPPCSAGSAPGSTSTTARLRGSRGDRRSYRGARGDDGVGRDRQLPRVDRRRQACAARPVRRGAACTRSRRSSPGTCRGTSIPRAIRGVLWPC